MKRELSPKILVSLMNAGMLILAGGRAHAQAIGYVTWISGIQSFNADNGVILNNFFPQSISGTIAASSDGGTLYSPAVTNGTFSVLNVLSAKTGEMVSQITGLYGTPRKTILDVTGTFAFVLCNGTRGINSVTVVNLAKQKAVGYVYVVGGSPYDIAMSPNGSQLFVSMQPTPGISGVVPQTLSAPASQGPIYKCKAVGNLPSLCIFNTQPFGLANTVSGVAGDIALSQDGTWLYAWNPGADTYLTAVNTTSLAVSRIKMPKGNYVLGLAVAPSGNQAVILGEIGYSPSFLLLDSKANTITGTLPGVPPQFPSAGSNVIAFSPDGSSLWSIGQCQLSCSLLVGQSFPSGNLISQTDLGASDGASAITF